ncbi:MAG: GNAT family N-acetyltransferase [Syntrophobacteraceae bacterium]
MNQILEVLRATPEMEAQIADFFRVLADVRESEIFGPHPFTAEQAFAIANYHGADFYAFAIHCEKVIGYGMLRGWDQGYDIPSLGISIHPNFRSIGIGNMLMYYLHSVASLRGCTKIRLRVNRDNHSATRLYDKMGYKFEGDNEKYLVGFAQLKQGSIGREGNSER